MEDEDRKLLYKVVKLTEENNEMLKAVQRRAKWARYFRIGYWVAVVLLALGAYYIVQPYIDQFNDSLRQILQNIKDFGELLDTARQIR